MNVVAVMATALAVIAVATAVLMVGVIVVIVGIWTLWRRTAAAEKAC